MGKVKYSPPPKPVIPDNVSIPYGKGKVVFLPSSFLWCLVYQFPMGKVKSKTNALDWCGNLYQFPMGKVKRKMARELAEERNVSIPYGKGKVTGGDYISLVVPSINSLWER